MCFCYDHTGKAGEIILKGKILRVCYKGGMCGGEWLFIGKMICLFQ